MGSQSTGIGGANMWALLLDKDPGHSAAAGDLAVDVVDRKLKKAGVTPVDVLDRKLKKAGVTPVHVVNRKLKKAGVTSADVEVAKPARRGQMVKKEKLGASGDEKQAPATVNGGGVQINVSLDSKLAVATATVSDGEDPTNDSEEIKEVLAALRRIEEGEAAEAKEETFDVVPARRGRRRTEAALTSKDVIVAQAVTGSNMWALLSDNDPGHGGPKPAKQGKKNKTNKKKNAAGASEQVEKVDEGEEKETPAPAQSELEEELSEEEEEEEMTGETATVGSRCLTVASGVFQAAVVAVAMLALYFELTLPSLA